MFEFILGTNKNDVVEGSSDAEYLNAFAGDDTINGGGGGDVLVGADGADRFVFSSPSDPSFKGDGKSGLVDAILDFTSGKDRIDLSHLVPEMTHELTFTGSTPKPYSVYYQLGCNLESNPMMRNALPSYCHTERSVTLMVDLDGDVQEEADFMIFLIKTTSVSESDLILS